MGARDGIESIVEAFYERVEQDGHLRPIYPADLGPDKRKLKLFLEEWLGGDQRYTALYGHPRLRHWRTRW